jgi:hypothetical protein
MQFERKFDTRPAEEDFFFSRRVWFQGSGPGRGVPGCRSAPSSMQRRVSEERDSAACVYGIGRIILRHIPLAPLGIIRPIFLRHLRIAAAPEEACGARSRVLGPRGTGAAHEGGGERESRSTH